MWNLEISYSLNKARLLTVYLKNLSLKFKLSNGFFVLDGISYPPETIIAIDSIGEKLQDKMIDREGKIHCFKYFPILTPNTDNTCTFSLCRNFAPLQSTLVLMEVSFTTLPRKGGSVFCVVMPWEGKLTHSLSCCWVPSILWYRTEINSLCQTVCPCPPEELGGVLPVCIKGNP